jgi:hypothetical protein
MANDYSPPWRERGRYSRDRLISPKLDFYLIPTSQTRTGGQFLVNPILWVIFKKACVSSWSSLCYDIIHQSRESRDFPFRIIHDIYSIGPHKSDKSWNDVRKKILRRKRVREARKEGMYFSLSQISVVK